MDDILLTLTEIARAQDEGVLAFHRAGGGRRRLGTGGLREPLCLPRTGGEGGQVD